MTEGTKGQDLTVQRIKPAYKQVADQLRSLVVGGELGPGERLPNESDLSSAFRVSRSTVREALRVLASQNLLTTSRGVGGGSFVAHPAPEQVREFLETSLGLLSGTGALSGEELLEARELLEVPAARLAAQRRSVADLESLQLALEGQRARADRDVRFESRARFHQALLGASGNRFLMITAQPLFTVIRGRFRREQEPQLFWKRVADDHARILERVEERDAEGAAEEMHLHLERLRAIYDQIDVLPDSTDA